MIRALLVFLSLFVSIAGFGQQRKIDSLKSIISSPVDDTGKVNAFRYLIGFVIRSNPREAIKYGKEGITLGKKLQFDNGLGGCYLNTSAAYTAASQLDSTLLYLDSALIYIRRLGDANRLALIYLNRADAYMQLRNLNQSLKNCDTALVYAEQSNNDDRLGRIYQTIGSVYYIQNNFAQSTKYYERALSYYRKIANERMAAVVLNNMGNVYKHTGNSKKAIENFNQAIAIADSLHDLNNLSLYHGNLSDVYLGLKDYSTAERLATLSMNFARQQQNEYQVAVAHMHFAEIYLAQKKVNESVKEAFIAYQMMKEQEDLTWQQSSADLLADAYARAGDYKNAFHFAKISKELNDSLSRQQFDEDIAAMQTSFRVQEKDKEIQLLSLDGEVKQTQLEKQRILLFTVFILLLLTIGGIFLLINRGRLKQRMKELELRNRIAADLHDEVGSSLSSIHVLSRMATQKEGLSFSQTLEKINGNAKDTMEKMSDIVWAIHPGNDSLEQLLVRMKEFAADMLEPKDINYQFTIEGDISRQRLNINQRRDIYLIFKEAVNNAAKYSECQRIQILLKQDAGIFQLRISDDGTGFAIDNAGSGNGIRNMRQRARQIGGELTIDSNVEEGTTIDLLVGS